jgi:uncharacterized Zn-binding protein involved in type VI secretion
MTKAVAVLGNATTTGGRIIQASAMSFDGQKGIAVVGDLVLCPECEEGKGVIITGADNFILDGKKRLMMAVLLPVAARLAVIESSPLVIFILMRQIAVFPEPLFPYPVGLRN